jgi:thymidylate synthase ThyX
LKIKLLRESGYEEALLGLSLNKNQPIENMPKVLDRLSQYDSGHNKALEQIFLWLDITAPRYWWSEFDTYRTGVSKQSESTMYTITKRNLTKDDFENRDVIPAVLGELNTLIDEYNSESSEYNKDEIFFSIKRKLPEGFLQRRVVSINYKSLRNIIIQRNKHRLPEWEKFINFIYESVTHKEFLPKKG